MPLLTLEAHDPFGDSIGIDSNLPDNFGRSVIFGLSALTSTITVSTVGGPPFILAAVLLGTVYYNGMQFLIFFLFGVLIPDLVSKVYGQTSRDMRRLGKSAEIF